MLAETERKELLRTWDLLKPLGVTVSDLFYRRLFELAPQYRSLFGEDMTGQKQKFVAMLAFIVKCCDWSDDSWNETVPPESDMFLVVLALGRRHTDLYKVPDVSYDAVGQALIWSLDYGLGEAFTASARNAWIKMFTLLAKTMKMGRYSVGQGSVVARGGLWRRANVFP